jgi:vitamin B12 transporter
MKNRNQCVKRCLGIMASSMFLSSAAFAATADSPAADMDQYTLDDTIVTATRTEKTLLETPANAQVITAEEIKKGGYMSVFEAVRNLTQANAHTYMDDGSDYGGMTSRIRIRGIDTGTLVLLNGSPCTFSNQSAMNNIPMDEIERIEVVRGSGSVLYGPQAIGGVINIITKKPGAKTHAGGNIFATAGNRFNEAGVNIQADGFDLGMKKSSTKDVTNVEQAGNTGSGPAMNIRDRKADQIYADVQLAKDLTFSYGRTNNKATFETGNFAHYKANMTYLGKCDVTYDNYNLLYDNKNNGVKVSVGYNTMDILSVYDHSYPKFYSDAHYTGYDTNLDAQKRFSLRHNKDSLIVGANYTRESLRTDYGTMLQGASNGRNSYSLYQSYDYQMTPKFDLILGLREYYMTRSKYQKDDFQLLPQLQGLYKVNKNSSYYFNIGKSFEMPQVSSGFFYGGNFSVNTNLKPQSGWSYEAGYKYDDRHRTLSADVFYMDVKDKFYWGKDSTGASIMMNRDKWKNVGLELNYQQKITDSFLANIGLTIQNPQAQSGSSGWVQDTSKYVLNIGTNYTRNKFNADARVFAYLDREPAYYNNARASSAASDHNLADSCDLTITLSYHPTDVDTIKLIGRNLLNRQDPINNYEYYCTPASFTLTYDRKF